ncbi:type II secretion system F family protein [Pseudoalteromonas xiamenensis]|uniref:type II secretion system F family protein n=1 Tax=Pseudoalteromonas xiamenensis TaxID=882626 RepID=UPI0027E3F06F|nr:type II secretion system F family protein [Pseudoalteromonas xiamenensis]WMN61216.1 type II secretion system F family protein [Pseudoalteromonas xiamenensis]
MEFEYKAIDNHGNRNEGIIEAENYDEAMRVLDSRGLSPLKISEINNTSPLTLFSSKKVGLSQIEFFTNELSLLLESGIKVDKAIDIIRQSNSGLALGTLLNQISSSLKKGDTLSEAFGKHEKIFGPLYIQLLKIGEASGSLSDVLKKLARDLKFQMDLRNQINTALAYPSIIFFVCMAAIYFVLTFIVPKMAGIIVNLDEAPWYTQLIIRTSNYFNEYQFFIIGSLISIIVSLVYLFQKDHVREWLYVKVSRFPGLGKILITSERIRFSQSIAMMLDAGLQLDVALELTRNTMKHPDFRRDSSLALKQLKAGKQLGEVLSKTRIFPSFFLSIIKVGEETGRLSVVFEDIATRSRVDMENAIRKFTTMLEPMMLLFMGGFVGGVVIVMLMSMVSMNDVPI